MLHTVVITNNHMYNYILNWYLSWAQRIFPPSADQCENVAHSSKTSNWRNEKKNIWERRKLTCNDLKYFYRDVVFMWVKTFKFILCATLVQESAGDQMVCISVNCFKVFVGVSVCHQYVSLLPSLVRRGFHYVRTWRRTQHTLWACSFCRRWCQCCCSVSQMISELPSDRDTTPLSHLSSSPGRGKINPHCYFYMLQSAQLPFSIV